MALSLSNISPTKRLRTDAAQSYARMRKAGLPSGITSAYRSWAAQQKLRDAYLRGKGNYAAKPEDSNHVKGTAVDVPVKAANWIRHHGAKYGWTPVANERWHFDYTPSKDAIGIAAAREAAAKKAAAEAKARAAAAAKKRAKAIADMKAIQKILGVTQDGVPGPKTEGAWEALKRNTK